MKFKIWKKRGTGTVYFTKAFYWRDYNKFTVDKWVMDKVFREILIIQVDEKEIIYIWSLKEKNIEDQRCLVIND